MTWSPKFRWSTCCWVCAWGGLWVAAGSLWVNHYSGIHLLPPRVSRWLRSSRRSVSILTRNIEMKNSSMPQSHANILKNAISIGKFSHGFSLAWAYACSVCCVGGVTDLGAVWGHGASQFSRSPQYRRAASDGSARGTRSVPGVGSLSDRLGREELTQERFLSQLCQGNTHRSSDGCCTQKLTCVLIKITIINDISH